MVGEVGKAKIAALEEIGEDELFEQIARGKSIRKIMAEQSIGYKLWAKWLDA